MHTSATEAVLQWPHFDAFPGLRNRYSPIFHLERSRPSLNTNRYDWNQHLSTTDTEDILRSFEESVNFWYPTMSRQQMMNIYESVSYSSRLASQNDSVEVCLALLTLALGLAGQVTRGLTVMRPLTTDEKKKREGKKAFADALFETALKRLHVVHTSVSSAATHCLFFIA